MMTIPPNKDALGHAVSEYFHKGTETPILVNSDIAEDDEIQVEYLFRTKENMPEIEQQALDHCKGNILDAGAGAGCHSLILQEAGLSVHALEISELCCSVMKERGIREVIQKDLYAHTGTYDVILMLMNGIGIAGNLEGLVPFLKHVSGLLSPNGFVLFDSSDIAFLYEEEDEPSWQQLNKRYRGELQYRMCYKDICGEVFRWLFIDFETLRTIAEQNGFEALKLAEGQHYDYLGMLRKKPDPSLL